jgi:mannose-6-phosphate isomerase-like protein (cupin superfamily)
MDGKVLASPFRLAPVSRSRQSRARFWSPEPSRFLFPPYASPPLHTHPQDESYVVVEGQLTVKAADEHFELEPGAVAVVSCAALQLA